MPKNSSATQLVAYLVPKRLPVILAKVVGFKALPSLAVFRDKQTNQTHIIEVPL